MAIWTVNTTADDGSVDTNTRTGTLRGIIGAAAAGDTIVFDDAIEDTSGVITIALETYLNVNKRLTIDGGETWTDNRTLKTRVVLDVQQLSNVVLGPTTNVMNFNGVTFKDGKSSGGNGASVLIRTSVTDTPNVFINCVFLQTFSSAAASNGGGIYLAGSTLNTLTNCVFDGCKASYGGGVCTALSSQNTFNNCTFVNCSATVNGGGFYTNNNSYNTFNNCTFKDCAASRGGGVSAVKTSQNILNSCSFTNCSASINGAALYLDETEQITLNNCIFTPPTNNTKDTIYNNGTNTDGSLIINGSTICDRVQLTANSATVINGNLTADVLTINNGATVTFSVVDSILAVTTTATIGAATFTASENSNGFLAVPVNTNISSATFTGVVACNYGAGITAFRYHYPNVVYTATNISIPALLQKSDSGSPPWASIALISESPYNYEQSTSTTFRLFDGATFLYSSFPGIGKHFETTAKFPIGYLVTKNTIGYLN